MLLHKADVLLGVGNFVRFEPDVEEELGDEAVDSLLECVPAGDVDAGLESEKNIEEPCHVGVVVVAAHDEHIEHMGGCLLHDGPKGGIVFRIFLVNNRFGLVQTDGGMGVIVMGAIGLDVVFPPAGHDDGVRGKERFPIGGGENFAPFPFYRMSFFFRKVAAVVAEADVVGVEVFPRPIEAGEFAIVRVLCGNVVSGVVSRETDCFFADSADVDGKVDGILRRPVGLMAGDEDFNIFFHAFLSWKILSA